MTQVTRLGRAGSVTLSKGLGHDQTEVDAGGDVTPPVDQVPVVGAAIETRVADVGSSGSPTLINEGFQDDALGLVTVTMSGGAISAGSLLLAWLCKRDDVSIVTPSGWTLVQPIVSADGHGGAAFWRVADGSEGSTVAFTGGPGSHRKSLYVQEWTGVITIDVSDRISEQAAATTHVLPSVTPTPGIDGVVVGLFIKDAQALGYTAGSGFTEDIDANVGSAAQPRGLVEHKIVSPTTGSYAPDATQATSAKWAGVVVVLVGDAGIETWEPAPEVGDENDVSYHVTDQDDYNLRADLGTSLLIDVATLLVSTLASGSRTFWLYGSNDPDFDTESLLDSQAFTSAGSYDPETLHFEWTASTAYRYYRVKVSDADTYRYYTLAMFLASQTTSGCGCSDKSRTIEESGAAITLDFTVANWWDVTLSDDCIVSVVNAPTPPAVGELHAVWRQPAVGGPFTITYGAEVLIPDTDGTDGGTPPTLHTAAGAEDVHTLTALDGETWGLSYDSAGSGGGGAIELQEDGVTKAATMSTLNVRHGLDADASGNVDVDESELSHDLLADVSADDHHNKSHVHSGDGSGTVAHSSLSGIAATDHHAAPAAGPDADDTIDAAGAAGTASTFARSGHGHKVVTTAGPGADATIDATGAAGSTGAIARAAHGHKVVTDTGVASTQAFGDSATAGTSGTIQRGGHKHAMPANPTVGLTMLLPFKFDGGGSAIAVGAKCYLPNLIAGTITRATLVCDTGTLTVEFKKSSYSGFQGSLASITGSAGVAVSSGTKAFDSTLSGWTTSITDDDVIEASVTAVSGATKATGVLRVTRT